MANNNSIMSTHEKFNSLARIAFNVGDARRLGYITRENLDVSLSCMAFHLEGWENIKDRLNRLYDYVDEHDVKLHFSEFLILLRHVLD